MLTGQAPFAEDSDQATIAHWFIKPVPRIAKLLRAVPQLNDFCRMALDRAVDSCVLRAGGGW